MHVCEGCRARVQTLADWARRLCADCVRAMRRAAGPAVVAGAILCSGPIIGAGPGEERAATFIGPPLEAAMVTGWASHYGSGFPKADGSLDSHVRIHRDSDGGGVLYEFYLSGQRISTIDLD